MKELNFAFIFFCLYATQSDLKTYQYAALNIKTWWPVRRSVVVSTPAFQPEPFYCCEIDPDLRQSGGPGFQNANSTGPSRPHRHRTKTQDKELFGATLLRRGVSEQEESRVCVDLHCTRSVEPARGRKKQVATVVDRSRYWLDQHHRL